MSVPPPMLAVPPPSMQSVEQIGTVTTPMVQSTNIVSQAQTMVTAAPVQTIAQQNQPQIIQQTILTPTGNMMIQQQPVQQSVMGNVTNLNVPPPTNLIPMKPGIVPPPPVQLSQPPPNIQLQQAQPTQIVLSNQPQTNYQYIHQQAPADGTQQQNSVTIQHIYQPQGIVQQTQPISTFTTQQARPPSQQYILQGNTA